MNQQGRKFESREVATRQKTDPVSTVRDLIKKSQKQIMAALPRHMDADRMARMAMTTFQKNPQLMNCDPISFVGAVIEAAQLGLEVDNNLGQAYFVPFRNNRLNKTMVQLIVGYRGLINLARRSGLVLDVASGVVYTHDEFDFQRGTETFLKHKQVLHGERGEPYAVYAVAKFTDGSSHFEVMSMEEVESIRQRSKASNDGPWKTDYDEMARKTAVRRLAKYMPLSPEYARAISLDNAFDAGEDQGLVLDHMSDTIDVTDYQEKASEEDLAKKLLEAGGYSLLKQPAQFQDFIELSADNMETDSRGVLEQATQTENTMTDFWKVFQKWAAPKPNQAPSGQPAGPQEVAEKKPAPETKPEPTQPDDEAEMSTHVQWQEITSLCGKIGVPKLDIIYEFTEQHKQKDVTAEQADEIIEALKKRLAEKEQPAEKEGRADEKTPKDLFYEAAEEVKVDASRFIKAVYPDLKTFESEHWLVLLASCYLDQETFNFADAEFKDGHYRLAMEAKKWGVKDAGTGERFLNIAQDRNWLRGRLAEVE